MKMDWVIIAEGVGSDAGGALTAIGVDQNVLIAPALPTRTKRAVIVHLVEGDRPVTPGTSLQFTITVTSPNGKVVSAQSGEAQLGPRLYVDLPGTVTIPVEFQLPVSEYGSYTITATVDEARSEQLSGSTTLYVVEKRPQPAAVPATSSDVEAV